MSDLFEQIRQRAQSVHLQRTTGLFGAVTLGVGALLGAGVYVLVGIASTFTGPHLWAAYAVCAALTWMTVLLFSRFAARTWSAGGAYLYAYEHLGPFWGFLVGWHLAVGSIFACALYAKGLGTYLLDPLGASDNHVLVSAVATAATVLLTAVAMRPDLGGGKVQTALTWGNVAVLLLVAGAALFVGKPDHFTAPMPQGPTGVFAAISIIYISFFGFQLIANNAEEIRTPDRTVPLAMKLSLLIAAAVYVVVALAAVAAVGYRALSESPAPMVLVAQRALGTAGGLVVAAGGVLAAAAALNSTLIAQSRQLYAMGKDRMLWRILGAVTRTTHVPATALALGAVACIAAVWLGDIAFIAKAANFSLLFSMLPVSIALMRADDVRASGSPVPWRARVVPIGSLVANGILLLVLGTESLVVGGLIAGTGLAVFLGYSRAAERRGRSGYSVALNERERRIPLPGTGNRILLPLSNPDTVEPLFTICRSLLPWRKGEIVALSIALSDDNTLPRMALQDRNVTQKSLAVIERIEALARQHDTRVHTIVRAARSVADGIRDTIVDEHIDLVVMGWIDAHGAASKALLGQLAKTHVDFAFLRMDAPRPFRRIGVAAGSFDNLPLMVRVASMLAEQCGGHVTYFSVVPAAMDAAELAHVQAVHRAIVLQHKGLCPYSIHAIPAAAPLDAIVEQSQNLDLLVVGTAKTNDPDAPLGAFILDVLDRVRCPVLVTRRTVGLGRFIPPALADIFTVESDD